MLGKAKVLKQIVTLMTERLVLCTKIIRGTLIQIKGVSGEFLVRLKIERLSLSEYRDEIFHR